MEQEELLNNPNPAPKKSPSPLLSLEKDLTYYSESMREVATTIVLEGLSEHPIFIAHQHQVNFGEMILNRDDLGTQWNINVATLEDFVSKGIIQPAKKESFISTYKPANDYMCIFVIVPEGANFVYYPYQK